MKCGIGVIYLDWKFLFMKTETAEPVDEENSTLRIFHSSDYTVSSCDWWSTEDVIVDLLWAQTIFLWEFHNKTIQICTSILSWDYFSENHSFRVLTFKIKTVVSI